MENGEKKISGWITASVIIGTFTGLFLLELRQPLRKTNKENKLKRDVRNLAIAATAGIATSLTEMPIADKLGKYVEENNVGLVKIVKMPKWLETTLAVVMLDYTLYVWHYLTHKVQFLWRFHLAHHVDLDMDATTAIRFHFGELTLSSVFRAAQILVIGVSPRAFSIYQTLLFPSVLFHHSNVELPKKLEEFLLIFIVTPRHHGIHHSTVREETDSNWSSGLSIWDRLHGTFRLDVPQSEITIGVPAYQNAGDLTFSKVLTLPFVQQRDDWKPSENKVKV
ncbi:MAG: sterol desaturase family protein [Pyrinomonadaceae bacterium]|nr:sterol desaturase family protein [Pyrinomonadaceae bacterium]